MVIENYILFGNCNLYLRVFKIMKLFDIAFIDFDDTLFDTHAFKQVRLDAIKEIGVSEDTFWSTYREARGIEKGKIATYSDELHAKLLETQGFDFQTVHEILKNVTNHISTFVLLGAVDFLLSVQEKAGHLVILSLGDPAFNLLKMRQSGLQKYVNESIVVDETKIKVLRRMKKRFPDERRWLFINDKVTETIEIHDQFPGMNVVLRQSPSIGESEYKRAGYAHFPTLKEVSEYIKNL